MHFFNGSLYKTKPTGKVAYVSDKKFMVEDGCDVQKLYPSSSGEFASLYEKTLNSNKEIYLAKIELNDGAETFWKSTLAGDSYVVFAGNEMKYDNIRLVPTKEIKEIKIEEQKQELAKAPPASVYVSDLDCYVTGNDVNVRDKPSLSGKSISQLNKGDAVKLVGVSSIPSSDYAQIVWKTKSGNKSGYISTKYISIKKPLLTKSETKIAKTAPAKSAVKFEDLYVNSEIESESSNLPLIIGGSVVLGIGIFMLLKKKNII